MSHEPLGHTIEYDKFLDCVHCGLCTSACPTYLETGDENDSPRGRIYLMRAIADERIELTPPVQRHLELCLDCRACETACPSGVQYGRLIEPFRVELEEAAGADAKQNDWFHRYILFGLFPYPERLKWALGPARIAQFIGLDALIRATGLWRMLPAVFGRLATMLPPKQPDDGPLPALLPAKGERRAKVALFTGCVASALFRHTHWATARVLAENGCDVHIPQEQQCCGAIHFHAGDADTALELANANADVFNADDYDAVILNVAGCGAMLKDYPHHWAGEGQSNREAFASKVRDIHEFLDDLGVVPPAGAIKQRVAYHDACHLAHAQGVRRPPRDLLRQIPGLELVDLIESEVCCGAAGSYNLTEPEMADRLGRRKLANIRDTGCSVVATANAGCLLQIIREASLQGETMRVLHPIDLLDMSYRGETL